VIAPAGVPDEILLKLNGSINRALQSDSFKQKFAIVGDEPAGGTPAHFARTIASDSEKWGEVVRRAGVKLE
jgi:tripartite-type tricarboxylate transporter receptor subunit TctC